MLLCDHSSAHLAGLTVVPCIHLGLCSNVLWKVYDGMLGSIKSEQKEINSY